MTKIEQLRLSTYLETKELLESYGKGCIVRPTGFGKTGILTRFIKDILSNKNVSDNSINIVYIYPSETVKNACLRFYYDIDEIPDGTEIPGVEFLTYTSVALMEKKGLPEYDNLKLIIVDECHKMGAEKTSQQLKCFLKKYSNINLLGATATPYRMDNVDVVEMFFDNHITSEYTLHDAFSDNVLKSPYYCYCSYSLNKKIKDENDNILSKDTRKALSLLNKKNKSIAIDNMNKELANLKNVKDMHKIIRDICEKYINDTSYLKGILFFRSFKDIHDNKKLVCEWFKKAYPDYRVNLIIVSTETLEYKNNVYLIDKLHKENKRIDLIFACDMLNLGYHVGNLSFIGMFRMTYSGTIFTQQLGRALSTGDVRSAIVFDWVDNLHSPNLIVALGEGEKEILYGKDNWKKRQNLLYTSDIQITPHSASVFEIIKRIDAVPDEILIKQVYNNWNNDRKIFENNPIEKVTPKYILEEAFPSNNRVPLLPYIENKGASIYKVMFSIFNGNGYNEKMINNYIKECKKELK